MTVFVKKFIDIDKTISFVCWTRDQGLLWNIRPFVLSTTMRGRSPTLVFQSNVLMAENSASNGSDSQDVYRTSREVLAKFRDRAQDLLCAHPLKQLLLSFLGGAFLTFGAAVAVALSEGSSQFPGPYKLYIAIGFMCGFVALFLSGAAAFNEVNVVLPFLMLRDVRGLRFQFQFWFIVWAGNLLGVLFTATLLNCAAVLTFNQISNLASILSFKLRYKGFVFVCFSVSIFLRR